jgi:hypothetical protein
MPSTRIHGGASTIPSTKGGKGSSKNGALSSVEQRTWRECFIHAIAGITSAHRRSPNPDLVVRMAARIADQAIKECRRRVA